jgi:hypothetical protein
VNEASWLAAENPVPMLAWLTEPDDSPPASRFTLASGRKLRLFACACTALFPRRRPALLRSVEVALAFADGEVGASEMDAARWHERLLLLGGWTVCNPDAGEAAYYVVRDDSLTGRRAEMAALLREVLGNPFRPVELRHLGNALCRRCSGAGTRPDVYPPAPCPACSCITPVALAVGRRAYDERDFAALPVLADALEEGGCEEAALLRHLRGQDRCGRCLGRGVEYLDLDPMSVALGGLSPTDTCRGCGGSGWVAAGPHALGCWALDLVLGKS